jgi:ribonucleoside-diphosphate reductase alpha chain
MPGGKITTDFDDYGLRVFGVRGKRTKEVTAVEHLAVLACATVHVDSSVSKTCNVPSNMPWPEFKELYIRAWKMGCKGLTTFQVGGKRSGIIKSLDEGAACRIDPESGKQECE